MEKINMVEWVKKGTGLVHVAALIWFRNPMSER